MNFVDATCKVVGDNVYLVAGPSEIELPPSKAKKLIDGGYAGKTVVLGIRPEDVHDEQMFIEASPNTVIEAKIRVYEMLGAEVFLYFDYEGSSMTARVDPRTTARTGDTVKFALDAEKIHVFDKRHRLQSQTSIECFKITSMQSAGACGKDIKEEDRAVKISSGPFSCQSESWKILSTRYMS